MKDANEWDVRNLNFIQQNWIFFKDKDKEKELPLDEVSVDDILDAQRREQEAKQEHYKLLTKALKDRGLQYGSNLTHDDMF